MSEKRGKLIAVEGIDGSGKATQAKMLAEQMGAALYSFPNYETETGKLILDNLQLRWSAAGCRERAESALLVPSEYYPLVRTNAVVLQSLFAVNRYEIAGEITRALVDGRNVVCDRYWLSGVVYGACDGLDQGWLARIHEGLPQPDCWILLDVDPSESVKRRPERRDRYEKDANMGRRRELYLRWFEEWQDDTLQVRRGQDEYERLTKWCVVNGALDKLSVHESICDVLGDRGLL